MTNEIATAGPAWLAATIPGKVKIAVDTIVPIPKANISLTPNVLRRCRSLVVKLAGVALCSHPVLIFDSDICLSLQLYKSYFNILTFSNFIVNVSHINNDYANQIIIFVGF